MKKTKVLNIPPEKRDHEDVTFFINQSLKNSKIKAEYDRLQPEFAVLQAIIDIRKKKALSQKELATTLGTTQSAISRLEKGNINPTIGFLQKLAKALDSRLDIRFLSYS